jgi:hypothetical protein
VSFKRTIKPKNEMIQKSERWAIIFQKGARKEWMGDRTFSNKDVTQRLKRVVSEATNLRPMSRVSISL